MSDGTWDPSPIYQPQRRPPSGWARVLAALRAIVRAPFTLLRATPRVLWRAIRASAAYALLATTTIGKVLLVPAALAAVVVTYWNVPAGMWAAWPIYAIFAAPTVLIVMAHGLGRWAQRPCPAVYSRSAADWLIARVKLSPQLGITVAELERGNRRNFYFPKTRTIVLSDTVRDEHTARAYAIAAHELGHALVEDSLPSFASFTLACRRVGDALSPWAGLTLLAIALTGLASWLWLPLSLFLVVALAHAAVALDELGASWLAMRELSQLSRRSPLAQLSGAAAEPSAAADEPRRAARRYLLAAFATYGSRALAAFLPLVCWPHLSSFFGEGLLYPGAPLSEAASLLASGAAIAMLIGLVTVALTFFLPSTSSLNQWFLQRSLLWIGLYGLSLPLFTVLVAGQPMEQIARWALLPALLPTGLLLAVPFNAALSALAARVPDLTLPASPLLPRSGFGIRPLTSQAFLRFSATARIKLILSLAIIFLLPLPLALLHLFG